MTHSNGLKYAVSGRKYIDTISHIASSSSQEEFFDKVIQDVVRIEPMIDTEAKAKKLIEEILFNQDVMSILDYSHKQKDGIPPRTEVRGILPEGL